MIFLLGFILSSYFFSYELTFLPAGLNTKKIIGGFGIVAYLVKCIKEKNVEMSRMVATSALIAVIFSVWCYFSIVANNTDDTTYAEYWISFATWLGGAYGVCAVLKGFHGRLDLHLITNYLAVICVVQCVLALLIDHNPVIQDFVDRYVRQGQAFLHETGRMYGIGCALDTGGIKFAAVLILLAHQLATNRKITEKKVSIALCFAAYFFITVVGNMIARTTTVGAVMGLAYIFLFLGFTKNGILEARQVRFYGMFVLLLVVGVTICVALYNANSDFRHNMRFAFEGFFNLVETGEFSTSSTDKLNAVMWIWPDTFRGWLIGNGIFGNFVYSTDIGYCRFTLYCGLIGLSIFSIFFIYNGLVLTTKFKDFTFMSLMIISLTFVIWLKVATDIFLIDALLFCIDGDFDEDGNEIDPYIGPDEEAVETA